MRQIVIDEITREERDNIDSYLKRTIISGPMEGMYWLPVPQDLLAEAQHGHEACGPFYFGVELCEKSVVFEMLVRSQSNLHCSCISYATPSQLDYLLRFIEIMVSEERIRA